MIRCTRYLFGTVDYNCASLMSLENEGSTSPYLFASQYGELMYKPKHLWKILDVRLDIVLQLYIRKKHRILDGSILTSTFGYENEVNTPPNSKLQHPLPFPANPRAFDCPPCPWGRKFESCPDGVRNFERKCQVLPMEYLSIRRCLRPKFLSFVNVKKVKVADFGFSKILGWAF